MSIRLAEPADAPALSKLAVEAYALSPHSHFRRPAYDQHLDLLYEKRLASVNRRIANAQLAVLEIEECLDGNPRKIIVGSAAWSMPDKPEDAKLTEHPQHIPQCALTFFACTRNVWLG